MAHRFPSLLVSSSLPPLCRIVADQAALVIPIQESTGIEGKYTEMISLRQAKK
jgi:hypothetical protein